MSIFSVNHIMSRQVVTCLPSTPVIEVAHRMVTECVAALLVVDDDGYAVGIVTQTDLLRAYQLLPSMQLVRLRSADLMSTDFVTCSPETPISEAVALLTRNHLHRVVVVKPNTQRLYPLGMLAMSDIVREVTGEFDVA